MFVWIAALLKILFVIAVVVGAFAPALVWAERRQSAMMQDRVGPHRAAIPLPGWLTQVFAGSVKPLRSMSMLFGIVGVAIFVGLALFALFGSDVNERTIVGMPATTHYILGFSALVLSGLCRIGAGAHEMLADGRLALVGLLHPLADALKMIFKEDFVPPKADKLLHAFAPILCLVPAVLTFAVIPFAGVLWIDHAADVIVGGQAVAWNVDTIFVAQDQLSTVLATGGAATLAGLSSPLQIASLNVGILFVFAIAGTGVVGAAIGGYASDNKFSLIGGVRAASQMVSYEVALGLTIVPCFMVYQSLRLEDMAAWQVDNMWGVFYPPLTLAFILYFTSAIAETKRVPFDLPEGESELVGGYLTEYSGMKFGMFFMSEFVEVVALACLAIVIFFGGWDMPFLQTYGLDLPGTWAIAIPLTDWQVADTMLLPHALVTAMHVGGFLLKVVALVFLQLTIRWTLPRFRYDQVMNLCWKAILPLSLLNILLTAILVLWGAK